MDRNDATAALADITEAQNRARTFRAYAKAGPIFAAWGLVWLVSNLTKALDYEGADLVAAGGIAFGVIASIIGGMAARRPTDGPRVKGKFMAAGWIFSAPLVGCAAIVGPLDVQAANVMATLIVGCAYAMAGLYLGSRILWLGIAVMVLACAAWLGAREYLELVLGLGGGGLLIGFGLWLWRQ